MILIHVSSLLAVTASLDLALALPCESSQHGKEKSRSQVTGKVAYEAPSQRIVTNSRCTQRMLTKSVSHKLENCSTHDFENLNRSTGDKGSVIGSFVTDDNEIICSRHHIQLLDSYNGLLLWQGVTTALVEENSGVDSIGLAAVTTNDHVDISQPSFERSAMNETELLNTFITTSSGCFGCGLVQGLVLEASSSSRRNRREHSGRFGCGGPSSACRHATCSWINVQVVNIKELVNDLPSSLKFIVKSFLKKGRITCFVLIVCCTLALLMCVCVGAGSSASAFTPARGRDLSFKSTGKIFFSSFPSSIYLHLASTKTLCFKHFFGVSNIFFRLKQSLKSC